MSESASKRQFADGYTGVRVQIKLPDGRLLVDTVSRSEGFNQVIEDAIRCMQYPCFHFTVDLTLPDGGPFPLEQWGQHYDWLAGRNGSHICNAHCPETA